MSKHTPGPWHAREWNCHAKTTVGIGAPDGRGFLAIAECSGMGHHPDISSEQEDANAQLIAAAPDLLEALRPFADMACTTPCGCNNCIARAVINRAQDRS